jgi:hypothetical protein
MNLESAIARAKELENMITQSAAQHNALIGALQEANRIVCAFSPTVNTIEKITEEVIEALPESTDV